jgi:hypothetical protein
LAGFGIESAHDAKQCLALLPGQVTTAKLPRLSAEVTLDRSGLFALFSGLDHLSNHFVAIFAGIDTQFR